MDKKGEIIVALDYNNLNEAVQLAQVLGDNVQWYKIGSVLFTKEGPEAVRELKKMGKKIFLDLKYHDIPNTVSGAVENCVELGVEMFTLHASGGSKMISSAIQTANKMAAYKKVNPPKAIAVTMLTSFSQNDVYNDFGISETPENIVKRLVSVVVNAGGNGVVASPQEIVMIRENFSRDITIITPGVRPSWSDTGDQKRVMTPLEAVKAGADFLVIGRPIIAAENPKLAAEKIISELKGI